MCLPFLTGRIVDAVTVQGAAANLRPFMFLYAAIIVGFSCCIFTFISVVAGHIHRVGQL